RGGFAELGDVIRPETLRRCAQRGHALDPIANLRAGVAFDRAFHRALVVVNEQPRRHELLLLIELDCPSNCIGRATAELALVVYRRALLRQIDLGRNVTLNWRWSGIHEVALVGKIRDPPIPLNCVRAGDSIRFSHLEFSFRERQSRVPASCHLGWLERICRDLGISYASQAHWFTVPPHAALEEMS